jgi:molybdate transport system substrate-binding protein
MFTSRDRACEVIRMTVRRRRLAIVVLALLAGVLTASPAAAQEASPWPSCPPFEPAASDLPASSDLPAADLTVFAAASLTDAFADLQELWTAAHPGSELAMTFEDTRALGAQIEEGAPADVVASTGGHPQLLVNACFAPGPITPFASNEFTIVVPEGNPAGIETAADLARSGVRIVATGEYRTSVLIENLSFLEGYPEDFERAVYANTVSEEDNVRAVLTKLERGEGDAAMVYVTDALSSADAVEMIPIPDDANETTGYAAVALADSEQPGLAEDFIQFLVGLEAQAVFDSYGFLAVTP